MTEAADEKDDRIEQNADGMIVVRLEVPVKLGRDEHSRLTLGRFKAKHVRVFSDLIDSVANAAVKHGASGKDGDDAEALEGFDIDIKMDRLVELANALATPAGIVDELLSVSDTLRAARAAMTQLGKFLGGQNTSGQ
jgi:hypothetical protein